MSHRDCAVFATIQHCRPDSPWMAGHVRYCNGRVYHGGATRKTRRTARANLVKWYPKAILVPPKLFALICDSLGALPCEQTWPIDIARARQWVSLNTGKSKPSTTCSVINDCTRVHETAS